MQNGSDEEYDVNSVVDGGPDEWHVIVDTEFEEEITVSAATMHRPDHLFSSQEHNSRILQCMHKSAGKIESGWTGWWLRDFGKQAKRARSVHGIYSQSQPLAEFVKCIGIGGWNVWKSTRDEKLRWIKCPILYFPST